MSVDHIAIVDFGYTPGTIMVPPGTTVTWTNTGEQPHTVTSLSTSTEEFDSGIMNHGQTYSHTFQQAGTYDYFCTVHPFMRGKVIVDANAPQPAEQAAEGAPSVPSRMNCGILAEAVGSARSRYPFQIGDPACARRSTPCC
jgi:amicyanin